MQSYRRRRLSAVELVSVSEHLSSCELCRRQIKRPPVDAVSFFTLKSEVFGEPEILTLPSGPAHLTAEQTAKYIDGILKGEKLQEVKDHLTWCKHCEDAVNDLVSFKDQVAPRLNSEYIPSLPRVAPKNHRHRLMAALRSLWPKFPLSGFVPVTAALLLSVTGWLVWQARQGIKTKPMITMAVPSPSISPSVLASPKPDLPGAMIIARLNDGGGQVTLDQDGKLSGADSLPPAYQNMVKKALIDRRLEISRLLSDLTQHGRTPRSDDRDQHSDFSVIEPVLEVTLSDHPNFRWSRLDGTTAYVVEIYDEHYALVATSPQITDHSWTAPQPLKRGRIYSWLVKAVKDGQIFVTPRSPAPQAKFRIMDRAQVDELARARRAYSSWRLTMGLLYVKAGLINDAERELQALQKANSNSAIVRQLLAQVQALRRR